MVCFSCRFYSHITVELQPFSMGHGKNYVDLKVPQAASVEPVVADSVKFEGFIYFPIVQGGYINVVRMPVSTEFSWFTLVNIILHRGNTRFHTIDKVIHTKWPELQFDMLLGNRGMLYFILATRSDQVRMLELQVFPTGNVEQHVTVFVESNQEN